MGRLANGRVVHVEVAADGADDHLARVHPDPDVQGHPCGPVHLLGVPLDRFLHAQPGVAGADGVVLVGERSTEESHDAVAHDLVDGALVVMDRLHHACEHRVEQPARVLGISVGEQLHRPLEVGEEDRDLLALSFEHDLRGQDPLGDVLRSVGLGRGEARGRCLAGGVGALFAELRAKAILVVAPRTLRGEPRLTPPLESSQVRSKLRPELGARVSRPGNS